MDKYTMGFKFRIYPNHTQQELINRTLGCCRFVFNHFLAIRRDEWTANLRLVRSVQRTKNPLALAMGSVKAVAVPPKDNSRKNLSISI